MNGHTPGPWHVEEYAWSGKFSGKQFAEYYICSGEEQITRTSSLDNARLIAAAPELLEAAKEVRDILRRDRRVFLADRLEQAIEKAEGGSP